MRTLVLCLLLGCAAKNASHGFSGAAPQPSPAPMDEAQTRACESCRHNLELCRQQQGPNRPASCMDDFMTCMNAQQLDTIRCQGLN
jgi:hypothetical protein